MPKRVVNFVDRKKYALMGALIGGVIFTALPNIITFAYNGWQDIKYEHLTDREDVFNYTATVPSHNPNYRDEPLAMVSHVTWYQNGWDVTFSDVLFCDGVGFVSSDVNFRNNRTQKEPLGTQTIVPWKYHGKPPAEATACYMESNIRACIRDGICKQQTIISGPIFYKERDTI